MEWSERKKDQLYSMVAPYEREVVKATHRFDEVIQSSNTMLELPINCRCMVMLGPPFLGLL